MEPPLRGIPLFPCGLGPQPVARCPLTEPRLCEARSSREDYPCSILVVKKNFNHAVLFTLDESLQNRHRGFVYPGGQTEIQASSSAHPFLNASF